MGFPLVSCTICNHQGSTDFKEEISLFPYGRALCQLMVCPAQKFQSDETVSFRVGCTLPPPPACVQLCLGPQGISLLGEFPVLGASQEESGSLNHVKKQAFSSAKVHCQLCPRVPTELPPHQATLWSRKVSHKVLGLAGMLTLSSSAHACFCLAVVKQK